MTEQTCQEPTNVQRAEWAKAALAVFTEETHGGVHPDAMVAGDLEDAICDLICDLLHFALYHPRLDPYTIHLRALFLFEQEIAGDVSMQTGRQSHDKV